MWAPLVEEDNDGFVHAAGSTARDSGSFLLARLVIIHRLSAYLFVYTLDSFVGDDRTGNGTVVGMRQG